LLDIVAVMNRPQGDEKLIKEAAIPLERALFPLLICIERFGPIGVGHLADRVGRDYTTVSRQVSKLESLDLVKPGAKDRRVSEAVIAPNRLLKKLLQTRISAGLFSDLGFPG
jgi:DNA-binding MarR family transcriptional regulator